MAVENKYANLIALLRKLDNGLCNGDCRDELLVEAKGLLVVNGDIVPACAGALKRAGYPIQSVRDTAKGQLCVYVYIKDKCILLYCDDTLISIWVDRWISAKVTRSLTRCRMWFAKHFLPK